MANNIIPLFAQLDSAEEALKTAMEVGYEDVIIIGYDKEGLLRYRSTMKDLREEIAAIELVKHHAVTMEMMGYE